MLRKEFVIALLAAAAGCPSRAPIVQKPAVTDDRALRVQIANAEARRAAGVGELVELVHHGDPHARELALRGLGRIGGDDARAALIAALRDPATTDAAAGALGVMSTLDDVTIPELAQASPSPAVIEALGRGGEASVEPLLAAHGATGALALGRFGRRKIALAPEVRAALVAETSSPDRELRYAAMYALAREHEPNAASIDALAAGLHDKEAPIRALAISGLARHNATDRLGDGNWLRDGDELVEIEAARVLTDRDADFVRKVLSNGMLHGLLPDHVAIEAVRKLHIRTSDIKARSELGMAWLVCLTSPDGTCTELPEHLRLPLLAERAKDESVPLAKKREWLHVLLAHDDPRVRGAGLGMLATMWPAADETDRRAYVAQVAAAIGANDLVLAGAAVDAAGSLYELHAETAPIDAALIARAKREQDVELSAALYELVGKQHLAAGADACRGGMQAPPVRARAAAECLRALGEATPTPPIGAATPPPVDVTAVIGRDLTWHLTTTRGEIAIHLRPDIAPWNVATIVALTRRHFYDGTEFHRVVPGFVVQGGDPTGSGAGGPGFTTPAEPAAGAWFHTGAVGIADAGRDSGGSQFFIMHAPAPHLDGRYTYIGDVVSGQNVADSLLIGDQVITATISAK